MSVDKIKLTFIGGDSVQCSQCHGNNIKVIESRDVNDCSAIRRRRMCLDCKFRFTTYERIEKPQLVVIKNDKTRQLFDRNKLLNGLFRACEKTAVTSLELEHLVDGIETQLYDIGEHEVESAQIGKLVMEDLANLNEVAYVRFASVYRRFSNIKGFEKELSLVRARQLNNQKN